MHVLIERKQLAPEDDVISELAPAAADPELTVDGIAGLSAGLLFAGHETTVTAIDRGVVLLLTHSRQANDLDEQRFPEPDQFDVHRANNPHLTFGHGPRFCVGASLARIELPALFPALLKRFPTLRLAVAIESLRGRDELLTGGLMELPVVW